MGIIQRVFGDYNEKEIKRLSKTAELINACEPEIQQLSDDALRHQTDVFKTRLEQGETLDDIMIEAFAVVREAARRVLGMRHFDVQLIGGMVLHQGRIAEMKTGEGKTLAATLPAYLNALTGKGVHIVTVNDYLASRDSEWMGKIFRFLGLKVGLIVHDMEPAERRKNYAADVIYGTNNEFGFDYLRDNMVIQKDNMVQRELNFAIIDEVDSILIDEARTPLIISGQGDKATELYSQVDHFVTRLKEAFSDEDGNYTVEGDYERDEKAKTIHLTEQGVNKAEAHFSVENLADPENIELSHHINQALRARFMMKRDIDYVVKEGKVIIVDEFTGRLMLGRRYSNGLHQAIEAKENVTVVRESRTLATITFQNYFRMYKKLSGMTGTAKTEEEEFKGIYGLDVVIVPTNKPTIRKDHNDAIYLSEKGKLNAVVEQIVERAKTGQPVLVGTISIEKSELISKMLKRRSIKHEVLNAKHHEKEAEIVAQAGKLNAITIATNMAGRGTDIMLGGNPDYLARADMRAQGFEEEMILEAIGRADTNDQDILSAREVYKSLYDKYKIETDEEKDAVIELGGLCIFGTERHESRRIDNQLRGRSGRQGDPGATRFYISLEDDLMRLFGSERVQSMVASLGMQDDVPLEYGLLSKQIENAQKKVEGRNYGIRKHVLQYDDVMNKQREIIYSQRRRVLQGENVRSLVMDMVDEIIDTAVQTYTAEYQHPEEWPLDHLFDFLTPICIKKDSLAYDQESIYDLTREQLKQDLKQAAAAFYDEREAINKPERMREAERYILLRTVDNKWMEHIDAMDQLRQGIGLRAYGQRDPVIEYQFEGFDMFDEMIRSIQEETVTLMFHLTISEAPMKREERRAPLILNRGSQEPKKPVHVDEKVGRNDPCPCGSGLKYKKCCGK